MRKLWLSLLILTGLLVGCAAPTATPSLRLLIPLYSCPSDEGGGIWRQVEQAGQEIPVTIIWGIICPEDDYTAALNRLGAAGVQRLAYIATHDSARPASEIRDEIAFYAQYPIEGFFFDEVSHAAGRADYNAALIESARRIQPNAFIVLNTSYAPPRFVKETAADVVIVLENDHADWMSFDAEAYRTLPRQRLAVLIHHASSNQWTEALQMALSRNIGWVYVTNRGWDALPSYFADETQWLQAHQP